MRDIETATLEQSQETEVREDSFVEQDSGPDSEASCQSHEERDEVKIEDM